jgi:hypothetical protein
LGCILRQTPKIPPHSVCAAAATRTFVFHTPKNHFFSRWKIPRFSTLEKPCLLEGPSVPALGQWYTQKMQFFFDDRGTL